MITPNWTMLEPYKSISKENTEELAWHLTKLKAKEEYTEMLK